MCDVREFLTGIMLLSLVSASAYAADIPECRNGSFPAQDVPFGSAQIIRGPRTYLRSDLAPCPDDTTACRYHAYLVPGDLVLTGITSGGYVCVLFPGASGGSAGYVRRDEIMPRPLRSALPLAAWKGTWHDGDNVIVLNVQDRGLTVSGEAYWPSAHPSPRLRPGGPDLGV